MNPDRRSRPVRPAAGAWPARRGGGLYFHIPFCASVCGYCHFPRTDQHDASLRQRVVDGILHEFELRWSRCRVLRTGRCAVETVYLGGGTPSVLEPEQMHRLLSGTLARLPLAECLEVTAEANPESFTATLAGAWRAAGIQRVSLGIQSLDEGVLKLLGRRCTAANARRALRLACQQFPRVSADWIIGPGVRRDRLLSELREAVTTGVEHVSLYILELHPGTELAADIRCGKVVMPTDARVESLYLAAAETLASLGLRQYEVANFARPGREALHNQHYWQAVPYLGLGPGAHGFWGRRRYANLTRVSDYLAAVECDHIPEAWTDPLSPAARRLERWVLQLRMEAGIPLAWLPPGALPLQQGVEEGIWELSGGNLRLTPKGFLRIDGVEEKLARVLDTLPVTPARWSKPVG